MRESETDTDRQNILTPIETSFQETLPPIKSKREDFHDEAPPIELSPQGFQGDLSSFNILQPKGAPSDILSRLQQIFNKKPSILDIEGQNCENPDMIIEEFERWKHLGPFQANEIEELTPELQIKSFIKKVAGGIKYYHGQVNQKG